MKLKGRRERPRPGEPLHTAMYTVYAIIHYSLYNVLYAARAPLSHGRHAVMDTWCDGATKKKILSQYPFYREKRGLFSTDAASSFSQDFDDPVSWWSNFGCEVPELQNFTMKALSQSTSASPCETNWCLYKSNRYKHNFQSRTQ